MVGGNYVLFLGYIFLKCYANVCLQLNFNRLISFTYHCMERFNSSALSVSIDLDV